MFGLSAPMITYDAIVQRMLPRVQFHQNRYAEALGSAVERGDRWLDIGAGTRLHSGWIGPSAEELAGRCRCVVGCDLDGEHLSRNPSLHVKARADAEALPFRDGDFQVVTANMVLEHLAYPARVFAEAYRVLGSGGRFVFVTPNRNHPAIRAFSTLVPAGVRRIVTEKLEGRASEHIFVTHYRANTPHAIRRLADLCGFDVSLMEVFAGYPMMRRVWPAVVAEALWIRVQELPSLRPLGSNLVGILRKP